MGGGGLMEKGVIKVCPLKKGRVIRGRELI